MEVVFSPPVCVEDIYIFIFLAKGCRGGLGVTNAPIPAALRIFSAQFFPCLLGEMRGLSLRGSAGALFWHAGESWSVVIRPGSSSESFPGACECVRGT